MAKQQKPTDQPQQEASAYSQDEAILLRYPDNGKVSAVSDLQVNNNLPRIVDVEPTQTNRASFMKKTSSNALATFFNQLWAHLQNPSLMPEIYIVPFSKVPDVASDLRKLHDDPKNDLARANTQKYRTYTQNLEKIKYDIGQMPLDQLAAMGLDIEELKKSGDLSRMERGCDTWNIYKLTSQPDSKVAMDGFYTIHPYQDKDGQIKFQLNGALAQPEFETDENLRMTLSKNDKTAIYSRRPLGRPLLHDGEYCLAGFNRNSNRMVYVPCKEVKAPYFMYNSIIPKEDQSEIANGGVIRQRDCHYNDSDNFFEGDLYFDVHERDTVMTNRVYNRPYIPEYMMRQLTPDQVKQLESYQLLDKQGLKDAGGNLLQYDVFISRQTNALTMNNYEGRYQRENVQQGQSRGKNNFQSRGVASKELRSKPMPEPAGPDYYVQDAAPEQKYGQSRRR